MLSCVADDGRFPVIYLL